MGTIYCVDTNIYLDLWERYPNKSFPGLHAKIDTLIEEGRWKSVDKVQDELNKKANPHLKIWATARSFHFVKTDTDMHLKAVAINKSNKGFVDPTAYRTEADSFIIAHAQLNNWTVVTHETPSAAKESELRRPLYIPDVCDKLKVPWITLSKLIEEEKWRFR